MYNQDIKKRFIEFKMKLTNAPGAIQSELVTLFNKTESFEEILGKDVAQMNIVELKVVFKNVLNRIQSKKQRLASLKEYVAWCMSIGMDGVSQDMLKPTPSNMGESTESFVSSPAELQDALNAICDSEDKLTMDNVYRCYMWLAYMGVLKERVPEIKTIDVDLKNRRLKYKYREIDIYDEAYEAFKNAVELDYFVYEHPNYTAPIKRQRVQSEELLRGVKVGVNVDTLKTAFDTKNKNAIKSGKTEKKLSYYKVARSGLYYETYKIEKAVGVVDFTEAALNPLLYGVSASNEDVSDTVISRRIRNFTNEYTWWKEVFNL